MLSKSLFSMKRNTRCHSLLMLSLQTLKVMKRYGATLLALEAGETIIVDQKKMIEFADKNNIVVMAV